MSAAYNEAVKRILSDINKFLTTTLKSESLSKSSQKEKSRLVDQLQDLFNKYDSLAPSQSDEGSTSSSQKDGSLDESRNTTGSQEDGYSDNILDSTVKNLTPDADKFGFLDKKHKDGLFAFGWKRMYCVLHKNVFYYFKKPEDKKQTGAFTLAGYTVQEAPQNMKDAAKKDFSFELVCAGKKSFQFCATSTTDFQQWRDAINKSEPAVVEADGDSEELYEPLKEPTGDSNPTSGTDRTALPPPPPPDDVDDDDLIYEPLDSDQPPPPPAHRPLPDMPPPPLPGAETSPRTHTAMPLPPLPGGGDISPCAHTAMPLPPIPGAAGDAPPPRPPAPGTNDDLPPPPPPAREATDSSVPPALPKRNAPLVPPVPAIPERKKRTPTLGELVHPSEDFENMFYGLYTCKGSSPNELNFSKGDIIHIINRELDGEQWWIGELSGSVGLVPKDYLHPAYQAVY